MATKKQKREAAQAKREAFLAEERERGLDAQRASHEADAQERERVRAQAERINHRYKTILAQAGVIEE